MKLTVVVMNDLKILYWSLSDSAVEVQHVGLCVVVPHRRLVVKFNHTLCALVLPPGQQWLVLLPWRTINRLQTWTSRHLINYTLKGVSSADSYANVATREDVTPTFRGRIDTLSWSMFIPGIMTLILRGPLNPKTLVS